MFEDKTLSCKECGVEFLFSAREQAFYEEKGFQNEPSRCPDCRAARKRRMNENGGDNGRPQREMFETVCAECGVTTTVPFRPTGDRPVYCRSCFQAHRNY
ncbi:zinc-ribbon domain containing protein [Heliophilum fasciatum]|uniref:CxxC-x17-CxxC domain-containing protein n=1 Tax=Heliophilum fasciatum TaxID=35700 RepID=A0A4R2RXF1_9FIRM|nr:zinc-ribbon domain containing protein [Heliophilum fasciatum]MCW2277191.1 CxxC-x17-CxxC domain-containing protein [Heliophilum fasciatum]TCP68174.1 CxxC-x17-CxxC domain-containing protein [Heliophilum fasciatum]